MKVNGQWKYLIVHGQGWPHHRFLPHGAPRRTSRQRFLTHAIGRHSLPETITIDGSEANTGAIQSDHDEHGTSSTIRRVKYLNNIVEQDHRAVKRIIGLIKEGTEGLTPAEQFYALAPNPQPNRAFSLRLSWVHSLFFSRVILSNFDKSLEHQWAAWQRPKL